MRRVVGISLGSSKRDHTARVSLLGQEIELSRRGTDGDLDRAEALIQELDGHVDAIGLGGIDVYLFAGGQRFVVRDGLRLMQAAKSTPTVDGSGIKDTLERDAVRYLERAGLLAQSTRVLMVSAVDRFGMAEAFAELGCPTIYGDLIFSAGMPYPITTLEELADIARRILPEMAKMPFTMLYPTGQEQERESSSSSRFQQYYDEADVIAGDWHLVRKYLPERLDGKWVLTNTTTARDIEELRKRGATRLVTTTPVMDGRSFGTNVIEAMLVALAGKGPEELGREGYVSWLRQLNLVPRVENLAGEGDGR